MTTPSDIARHHFEAALAQAAASQQSRDATVRAFIYLVGEALMRDHSVEEASRQIISIAENIDPDADYMFMRP